MNDNAFRYGFLYISVDSLYTNILSRVTCSEFDITCVYYVVDQKSATDNKEKIVAFDNYTRERIDCIKSFDIIYNCKMFKKMTTSSPELINVNYVKTSISELIFNATENRTLDNLRELLLSLDNYRCYGDMLTERVLGDAQITKSTTVILNSDNTNEDVYDYYDSKLTTLFEVFPMVLREKNDLLTSLFTVGTYNVRDFDRSFPNSQQMNIVSNNINDNTSVVPRIHKGIERIKVSIKSICRTIDTWKLSIINGDVCRINTNILVSNINDVCDILGMNNISFDIDIGDYISIISNKDEDTINLRNGNLILSPNLTPDLSTLSISVLKDLITYIREVDCTMSITLQNQVIKELSKRRIC